MFNLYTFLFQDDKSRYDVFNPDTDPYIIESEEFKNHLKKYNMIMNTHEKVILYKNAKISYKYYFNEEFLNSYYGTNHYIYDKNKTYSVLEKYNIPYPKSSECNNVNMYKNNMKFPIMIKPKSSSRGMGIIGDIKNMNELKDKLASIDNNKYIIQEQITGISHRIIVFKDMIILHREQYKPYVIGDNIHTIQQLINNLNIKNKRETDTETHNISELYIKQQGFNLNSVAKKNEIIYITNVVNAGNGCINKFRPIEEIHPINVELFIKTHKTFGLTLSGIDYIGTSLAIPYYNDNGKVLELNWKPGISNCTKYYPDRFINAMISDIK